MKATISSAAIALLAIATMTMSQPLPQLESSPAVEEPHPVIPLEPAKVDPIAQSLPTSDILPKSELKPEEAPQIELEQKPKEPKLAEPESKPIEQPALIVPAAAEPIEEPKEAPKAIVEPKEVLAIVAESLAPEKIEEPAALSGIARSAEPEAPKTEEVRTN